MLIIHCKLVNRGNLRVKVLRGHPVTHMIAVNTRDTERFSGFLFNLSPSIMDPSAPSLKYYRRLLKYPYPNTHHTIRSEWKTRTTAGSWVCEADILLGLLAPPLHHA